MLTCYSDETMDTTIQEEGRAVVNATSEKLEPHDVYDRNELGNFLHDCWTVWTQQLLEKYKKGSSGSVVIPKADVVKLRERMDKYYEELEDKEAEINTLLDLL